MVIHETPNETSPAFACGKIGGRSLLREAASDLRRPSFAPRQRPAGRGCCIKLVLGARNSRGPAVKSGRIRKFAEQCSFDG
jgi:hypothetical protein